MVSSTPATADSSSPDADARQAWSFALGLDETASPERIAAVTSVLVTQWRANVDRVTAAAAVCRARHAAEGSDSGWQQAAELLERAERTIRQAGADTDEHARAQLIRQMFPEPEPYRWPTNRRRTLRWWLRRLDTVRVRFAHQAPAAPAGIHKVTLHLGRLPIGTVLYQVCDHCRRGLLGKISIDGAYQGYGLGTRAILRIHREHPGYDWYTTAQMHTAGSFWPAITRRTGGAFTEKPSAMCLHIEQDRRH
jgi:hypothetical protein